MTQTQKEPSDGAVRFVHLEDLQQRGIKYSQPHLIRLEKAGRFPARVYLGPKKVAWLEREIDAWVATRLSERGTAKPAIAATKSTSTARSRRWRKTAVEATA